MRLIYLLMGFSFVFAAEYNFAPKVIEDDKELPIVVMIASYNNVSVFKRNLDTLFSQDYSNYRVLYTDDASTDGTYAGVVRYIEERGLKDKIIVFRNDENRKAMYNQYNMVHKCKDHEIVFTYDGDDWLPDNTVFKRLNQAYLDKKVWMTFGNNIKWPSGEKGTSEAVETEILKNGEHRKILFGPFTQPRTFYAGLFKSIPMHLFMKDGKFFDIGHDVAIMYYLMDLCREHTFFIPEVNYVYNVANPINDFKVDVRKQLMNEYYIKRKPPLKKLSEEEFLKLTANKYLRD